MFNGASFEVDGARYQVPAVDVTAVYNEGFAEGKKESYDLGVADGKAEGRAEAVAECKTKHFVTTITPETTATSIEVDVPFEPDTVLVYGMGSDNYVKDSLAFYFHDKRYADFYAGATGAYSVTADRPGIAYGGASVSGMTSRYTYIDGKLKLSNLKVAYMLPAINSNGEAVLENERTITSEFVAGKTYCLIAVKYS